ncbi:hypothetical protein [Pseudanabaena minima]|uniref:hypothetical protein n=1 Tax=Pseudanabaena minima TaxID=890415 RepID=UPI003DA91334
MAVVWIVTTGNSDVVMSSKNDWEDLRREKRLGQVYDQFEVSPLPKNNNNEETLFALPARALGTFYEDALDDDEYWETLRFPLLKGFVAKLNDELKQPTQIIILLTDQKNIFDERKVSSSSPFWQDTCKLEPIFRKYFSEQKDIQSSKLEFVYLTPEKNGLDDWNATLTLVQEKFTGLGIDKNDDVIVSHQAGTPAISSAVQFASLSNFGDRVSFLTSNERTGVTSLNLSSSYFEAMQIEQAKKFLDNYDYVSVLSVLKGKLERLKADNPDQADKIIKLLEVAKLWNLSKFDEFKEAMKNLPIPSLRDVATGRFEESWAWWIAYEEAYLGIIRRNQGNIVEAFFHSFRAFEGIFAAWGNHFFNGNENEYVDLSKDIPYLKADVLNDPQSYLSGSDLKKLRDKIQKDGGIDLELSTLCKIFKEKRKNYKQKCKDIITFWDNDKEKRILARRNFIFHQVQGITEEQLLSFWLVDSVGKWQDKIRQFLNFIADEKEFKTWNDASLMARVHKELVDEIGAIANIPNS